MNERNAEQTPKMNTHTLKQTKRLTWLAGCFFGFRKPFLLVSIPFRSCLGSFIYYQLIRGFQFKKILAVFSFAFFPVVFMQMINESLAKCGSWFIKHNQSGKKTNGN